LAIPSTLSPFHATIIDGTRAVQVHTQTLPGRSVV
jgi:hypothetical protein